MDICSQCGARFNQPGNFCSICGTPTNILRAPQELQPKYSYQPTHSAPPSLPVSNFHHSAARGFAQMFGLHPAIAFLTVIVDSMIFGGAFVTGGASEIVLAVPAAITLGFIAYRAQIKWYGDDKESALIKALILAFLTAIPTNLPAFVYVPAGILGFFKRK